MRDLSHTIKAIPVGLFAPAVQAAGLASNSVDTEGLRSITFIVSTGAIVGDGDFGLKLQEADTLNVDDFADVQADLTDSNAPATLAAGAIYEIGYRGWKRHLRVALTKAGGTSIVAGAVAVGVPLKLPAA